MKIPWDERDGNIVFANATDQARPFSRERGLTSTRSGLTVCGPWHGYGTWSVALKKGLHPFKAIYVDYRTDAAERFNHPGMRENTIWGGTVPELLVSGPGLEKQPIPQEWFFQR